MYLYAITDRPDLPLPEVQGIGGAGLASMHVGKLAVVVSTSASVPSTPTPEALWQHERVLETLMKDRTVLPVRFGTRFSGEQAVRAEIASKHDRFVQALERVRGYVEIGLRVFWKGEEISTPANEKPATGRDYMVLLMARAATEREHRARAEALAEIIVTPLRAHAVEYEQQVLPSPGQLLTAAFLVPADRVEQVREEARMLAENYPDLPIVCTGPWPPYSFTNTSIETNDAAGIKS